MIDSIEGIELDQLRERSSALKAQGYRFVTASATELDGDSVDLLYSFDRDLDMVHLRATAQRAVAVPSLSPVFFAALLVENEIQDQFALRFADLVLDYGRSLMIDPEVSLTSVPLCNKCKIEPLPEEKS